MKTAEELLHEYGLSPTHINIVMLKDAQLDAKHEGMRKAAAIQRDVNGMMSCMCCQRADKAILAADDKLTL